MISIIGMKIRMIRVMKVRSVRVMRGTIRRIIVFKLRVVSGCEYDLLLLFSMLGLCLVFAGFV